jgi:hypothetical protein
MSDDRDIYLQKAIERWENEGGAPRETVQSNIHSLHQRTGAGLDLAGSANRAFSRRGLSEPENQN